MTAAFEELRVQAENDRLEMSFKRENSGFVWNELEALKEEMAKTGMEIGNKLDEREEKNKVLKKKITSESRKINIYEGKVAKLRLLYEEAAMIQRETERKCQQRIQEMVALMEKHKHEYEKMAEEKDTELKVYKIKQQEQLAAGKSLVRSFPTANNPMIDVPQV
ncbi:hypothetical protein WISP_38086 [Willisornis vidua]|uniref:Uncharacterized protein n=1 Tax=Willisornis vidua TaxID=1566151 RepID=A0ABQ9DI03_9PASS|nr:hypothetical protein WISP_38086 [Willisornis vidua]